MGAGTARLHATWEQLAEKYPGRARAAPTAPRTEPDGAWVADGNRRLNPEQNSEACKACKDVSDEGKQAILPACSASRPPTRTGSWPA